MSENVENYVEYVTLEAKLPIYKIQNFFYTFVNLELI